MNFLMVPSKLCKSCPTTTCMCFPQPCSSFNREMYPKKSCSKWTKNDANRLDIVKFGANLVLDRKVGFSHNWVCQTILVFNPVQPHIWHRHTITTLPRRLKMTRAKPCLVHGHKPCSLTRTLALQCSLTTQQADILNTYWLQHVQITNGKLKTK